MTFEDNAKAIFFSEDPLMSRKHFVGLAAFLIVCMMAFASVEADAARFGRGMSFGSRPTMSQPYKASPSMNTQRQQTTTQNSRQQAATAATAGTSRGLFGGMGGLFGGLLAGSLIGSLLFGGGFHGGGMLDIIILALIVFFALRLFSRRRASQQAASTGSSSNYDFSRQPTAYQDVSRENSGQKSGFDWGALGSNNRQQEDVRPTIRMPEGFDEEEFIRGAKAMYTRLNASWDCRDMDDIAQFTTPGMAEELRRQAKEDPAPGTTEILLINARLLEVKPDNGGKEERALVYFDVLLREDPHQDAPIQVREVWHFTRASGGNSMWMLDQLQQVEN